MKKITHQLANLGMLFVFNLYWNYSLGMVVILAIFSWVLAIWNDWIDFNILEPLPHRNFWSHGIFSPLVLINLLVGTILGNLVEITEFWNIGVYAVCSYYLHLLLDLPNPTGIYLWPSKKIHGKIYSDSFFPMLLCKYLRY